MPTVQSNGIEIAYEVDGPESGPAVVMIMGLGVQLTGWPRSMYRAVNAAGYRTIRFDNRDIGLSGKMDGMKAPNIVLQTILSKLHIAGLAPYKLTDMATDTIGLIDALGLDRVHLVGISMGGMIGQIAAAIAPDRIKSFTAIMTSTNGPGIPGPRPAVTRLFLSPGGSARYPAEAVDRAIKLFSVIGTKDSGETQDELRTRVQAAIDRCNYPAGIRRQTAAIIETGDLRRWTRKIKTPTLVLHGTADPLVHVAGGKDIVANIPNSRLQLFEGLGHDLPEKFVPELTSEMVSHFQSADIVRAADNKSIDSAA